MTVELKTIQVIPRPVQAVQLTDENLSEVAAWVQSKLAFQKVDAVKGQLFLPSVGQFIDILEPGDWVLYDPDQNVFTGAEDSAIQQYYTEVADADTDRSH